MSEWKVKPLEDCLDALIDYRGKSPKKSNSGIPVLSAKVIKDGKILRPVAQTISPAYYKQWMTRGLPKLGDVVLTTEGPLGEVAQIDDDGLGLGQRIVTLRGKQGILDTGYLKYFLMSPVGQNLLQSRATGTTVEGISQKALRALPITLPPYKIQKEIASTLYSIEKKYELNQKMNETLEEMARALFKRWFVDFDPVRAKVEGKKPEGMDAATAALFPDAFNDNGLPEGWKVGRLGDIITQRNERISPSKDTEVIPYVPIDCISSKSLFLSDYKSGSEAKSSLIKFYQDDILFGAMRPYFHKVCIAPFDGTTRTTAFVLYPSRFFDYSFSVMCINDDSTIEYATQNSTGSTIPYIKWDNSLANKPIVIPSDEIRQAFDSLVRPILNAIPAKFFETSTLSTIRDNLLPKLISGELRIEDKVISIVDRLKQQALQSCIKKGYTDIRCICNDNGIAVTEDNAVSKAQIIFDGGFHIKTAKTTDNYSIAHELGHYALHPEDVKKYAVGRKDEYSLSKDKERQAEEFASELMMPETYLRDCLAQEGFSDNSQIGDKVIKSYAKKFHVSEPAMRYRLNNLGYKTAYKDYTKAVK